MKAFFLLLLIIIGVLCVPVEGCMRGGVSPIGSKAIIALCVVFSPVILVVGAGYLVKETGKTVVRSAHRKRVTSNIIRKQRNRMIKKIGAKNFDNYLQGLVDKTKTEPSPDLFAELGTALFLNNDLLNANDWLTKALATFSANPIGEFKKHGAAYFMRGMVNQYLYDFVQAAEDFTEAQKHLGTASTTKTGEEGAELPQLTVYDAINAGGFAKMQHALYGPVEVTGDANQAKSWLNKAIEDIDRAIETSPEVQGMYFHNRGFARYHRAYHYSEEQLQRRELELAVADFTQAIESGNFGTTAEGHSMKSQCLARLGRLEEAKEEQEQAIELDRKAFTVELNDEVALKVPWPLPNDKYKNATNTHTFTEVAFKLSHYCSHCASLIKKGKGFECYSCGYRCHTQCVPKATGKDCWQQLTYQRSNIMSNTRVEDDYKMEFPQNHVHHMRAVHFRKPTWCGLCLKFVASPLGKQGFLCKDCGLQIHKGCIEDIGPHVVEQD